MEKRENIGDLVIPTKLPELNHKASNVLNLQQELLDEQYNIKEIRSLHLSSTRMIIFIMLGVIFCLIPFLLYKWFLCVRLLIYIPAYFTPLSLGNVTHILVIKKDSDWEICAVNEICLPENAIFHVFFVLP